MEREAAGRRRDGVQVTVEFEVLDERRRAEGRPQLRRGRPSGDQAVHPRSMPGPVTDRVLDRLLASDERRRHRSACAQLGYHLAQLGQIGDQRRRRRVAGRNGSAARRPGRVRPPRRSTPRGVTPPPAPHPAAPVPRRGRTRGRACRWRRGWPGTRRGSPGRSGPLAPRRAGRLRSAALSPRRATPARAGPPGRYRRAGPAPANWRRAWSGRPRPSAIRARTSRASSYCTTQPASASSVAIRVRQR